MEKEGEAVNISIMVYLTDIKANIDFKTDQFNIRIEFFFLSK